MNERLCEVPGCGRRHRAKGLCSNHYNRMKLYGDPISSPPRVSAAQRFESKVERTEKCWNWTGTIDNHGYGRFKVDGKGKLAHRLSWVYSGGYLDDELTIDHMCHNRRCVNPAHLRAVPNEVNIRNLSGPRSNSATQVRGVFKDRNSWRAQVRFEGKAYRKRFHDFALAEAWVTEIRNALHQPPQIP